LRDDCISIILCGSNSNSLLSSSYLTPCEHIDLTIARTQALIYRVHHHTVERVLHRFEKDPSSSRPSSSSLPGGRSKSAAVDDHVRYLRRHRRGASGVLSYLEASSKPRAHIAARDTTSRRFPLIECIHLGIALAGSQSTDADQARRRGRKKMPSLHPSDVAPPPTPKPTTDHKSTYIRAIRWSYCCPSGAVKKTSPTFSAAVNAASSVIRRPPTSAPAATHACASADSISTGGR